MLMTAAQSVVLPAADAGSARRHPRATAGGIFRGLSATVSCDREVRGLARLDPLRLSSTGRISGAHMRNFIILLANSDRAGRRRGASGHSSRSTAGDPCAAAASCASGDCASLVAPRRADLRLFLPRTFERPSSATRFWRSSTARVTDALKASEVMKNPVLPDTMQACCPRPVQESSTARRPTTRRRSFRPSTIMRPGSRR